MPLIMDKNISNGSSDLQYFSEITTTSIGGRGSHTSMKYDTLGYVGCRKEFQNAKR